MEEALASLWPTALAELASVSLDSWLWLAARTMGGCELLGLDVVGFSAVQVEGDIAMCGVGAVAGTAAAAAPMDARALLAWAPGMPSGRALSPPVRHL